jgi:hypothetical protein
MSPKKPPTTARQIKYVLTTGVKVIQTAINICPMVMSYKFSPLIHDTNIQPINKTNQTITVAE